MIISDEDVIAALLKDAKKFKSKWELHTNEPTRSKPNVNFLKRTLKNVVKVNQDRMRKEPEIERDSASSSSEEKKKDLMSSSTKAQTERNYKSKHKMLRSSKVEYRSLKSQNKSRKGSKYKETSSSRDAKKSL